MTSDEHKCAGGYRLPSGRKPCGECGAMPNEACRKPPPDPRDEKIAMLREALGGLMDPEYLDALTRSDDASGSVVYCAQRDAEAALAATAQPEQDGGSLPMESAPMDGTVVLLDWPYGDVPYVLGLFNEDAGFQWQQWPDGDFAHPGDEPKGWWPLPPTRTKARRPAMTSDRKYPELDKMAAVRELSQAQGSFLDWLHERGYVLARHETRGGRDELVVENPNIEALLAEFHGIDLQKIEQERRELIAAEVGR